MKAAIRPKLMQCAVLALLTCCRGTVIDAGTNGAAPSSSGVTTIATLTQELPITRMVSDNTFLYWLGGQGLSRMPAGGGPITRIVVPIPVAAVLGPLVVDSTNVYFIGETGALYSAPKAGGGTPVPLMNGLPSPPVAVTVLGTHAYWIENDSVNGMSTIKSVSLQGGPVSVVSTLNMGANESTALAVTTSAAFVDIPDSVGDAVLLVADGGPPQFLNALPTSGCQMFFVSDTSAVYCGTDHAVIAIASDGTETNLGPLLTEGKWAGNGALAFDDTNVYWVHATTLGAVMKAPKAGGAATMVARDTLPFAIAVDDHAVYWSDTGGNIMRIAK